MCIKVVINPDYQLQKPTESINSLHVKKLDPSEYPYLNTQKMLEAWQQYANQAAEQLDKQDLFSKERETFSSSSCICHLLSDDLKDRDFEFYVCCDALDAIQGIMALEIEPDDVYLGYLATHPHNIRSKINETIPNRVKGVGACLVQKVEEIAWVLKKKQVTFIAGKDASEFYTKLGYQFRSDNGEYEMFKELFPV